MEKLSFIRVRLIVNKQQMTPNDVVKKFLILPIESIASLTPYSADLYSVTLKKDYQHLVHERYERLEVKLAKDSIQIFGEL